MLFISKWLSGFRDRAFYVINRKALPQHIVFCDEDHIAFIKRFILCSRQLPEKLTLKAA